MPADGSQYTLLALRNHIRSILKEASGNSFWDDADLDKYVTQTLDKMRLDFVVDRATYTTTLEAGEQTLIPAGDVWKIERIDLGDKRLREISEVDMDALTGEDWDVTTAEPCYWFHDGTYIRFDSVLSENETINLWYWKRPAEITTDAELMGIYTVFMPVILHGAVAQAYAANKEWDAYQANQAEFLRLLELAKLHPEKKHRSDPLVQHDTTGW